MLNFWKELYNQYVNNIDEIWNEEVKQKLFLQFEEEKKWNTNKLTEHLDMVREVEEVITPMELAKFNRTMINDDIKKLKNKKAADPDRMKTEFYKEVAISEVCLDIMTECFGKEISNKQKTVEAQANCSH